jgi:hypothetical protein
MSFLKSKTFKYAKNLLIGVGAAIVLMGALFKLESWPYASEMLTAGLTMEAIIFLFLGVIGPEPDYYWDKLYPGLSDYHSNIAPITEGGSVGAKLPGLNGEVVEQQLGGMLNELQGMSSSLGSLKALQEVDFSQTGNQMKSMSNFYTRMNEAMSSLNESLEDTKQYSQQLTALNKNIGSLNNVYGNVLSAMANANSGKN